jgi:hypothetical protein
MIKEKKRKSCIAIIILIYFHNNFVPSYVLILLNQSKLQFSQVRIQKA